MVEILALGATFLTWGTVAYVLSYSAVCCHKMKCELDAQCRISEGKADPSTGLRPKDMV
jgi:hypothetical protein